MCDKYKYLCKNVYNSIKFFPIQTFLGERRQDSTNTNTNNLFWNIDILLFAESPVETMEDFYFLPQVTGKLHTFFSVYTKIFLTHGICGITPQTHYATSARYG